MAKKFNSDQGGGIVSTQLERGELRSQEIGGGQRFETFDPKLKTPPGALKDTLSGTTPAQDAAGDLPQVTLDRGKLTQTGANRLGVRSNGSPIYNPATISPEGVFGEAREVDNLISEQRDLFGRQQEAATEETESLIQGIESDYEAQKASLEATQAESKKTEKAIQFKLGQSGTAFGVADIRKRDLERRSELTGLLDKKQDLIRKASAAYKKDNIAAAQAYTKEIRAIDTEYYNREREQRQDRIKEYLDLSGEERAERKFSFDQDKFFIGEDRLNRSQALTEDKFDYQVSQDAEEKALENIKRIASSRIPLDQLSDEEINRMEYEAGIEPGTFEAFYSKILDETEFGETMDQLKMDQLKAQIARTKQLAAGKGTGTGKTFTVGNREITETGDTFTDTIAEMSALRDQNLLTDFGYKERVNALMEIGGYDESQRGDIESMINNAMEGAVAVGADLEADNNVGSDFVGEDEVGATDPLGIIGSQSVGEALAKVAKEIPGAGRQIQEEINRRNLQSLGETLTFIKNFVSGLTS